MPSRDEQFRDSSPYPRGDLESPFLEGELLLGETEAEWEPRVGRLQAESPFHNAFEQGRTSFGESEAAEEEFAWERDELAEQVAEAYDDYELADLEDGMEE